MAGCLIVTAPLEWLFGARVYRRFRSLLLAVLPVALVFSIWDVVGIARGHWTYNPGLVTGVELPLRLPLEELVFFVVIPVCGLLTYEAVGAVLDRFGGRARRSQGADRRSSGSAGGIDGA